MKGYRIADWDYDACDLENGNGKALYKQVDLEWTKPTVWNRFNPAPECDTSAPIVYALVRNHHKAKTKDHIVYIGLTSKPKSRFQFHPTATQIRDKLGEVTFSYAPIDFIKRRNRKERTKRAMEEIEHLLIWTLYPHLQNVRKWLTLPGMGTNPGTAWIIRNTGHRFSGQMPREIVYPWMLVKPGRDRTRK